MSNLLEGISLNGVAPSGSGLAFFLFALKGKKQDLTLRDAEGRLTLRDAPVIKAVDEGGRER